MKLKEYLIKAGINFEVRIEQIMGKYVFTLNCFMHCPAVKWRLKWKKIRNVS